MKTKFKLRFTPSFLKRIKALDRKFQVQILKEVNILKTTLYAGKPLHGEWKGIYSLRIGEYRILYQIKGNQIILLVAGHRKRVYG